jgi:DNA-directed RNA polymerase alpha subunit
MIYQYTYQPTTKPMSEQPELQMLLTETKDIITLLKEFKQTIKQRIVELEEDKQQWHDNALERAHKQLDDMQILKREAEARRLKEWEEQCDREQKEDERIRELRSVIRKQLDEGKNHYSVIINPHLPFTSRHGVSREDVIKVFAFLDDYEHKTRDEIINDEFTG